MSVRFSRTAVPLFFYFLFYAVVLIPVYFFKAYIPDEQWCYLKALPCSEVIKSYGVGGAVLLCRNHFGYGSLYWLLYGAVIFFTKNPMAWMRIFAYGCMLSLPAWIAWHGIKKQSPYGQSSLWLWLTFPMAWWAGKVTAPDLYALFWGVGGLSLAMGWGARSKRLPVSFLMIGAGLGIKLTLLPLALFAVAAIVLTAPKKVSAISTVCFFTALGYLSANPFLCLHPREALAEIHSGAFDLVTHGRVVFRNMTGPLNLVYEGNFFHWGIQAWIFPVAVYFFWKSGVPKKMLAVFLAVFLFAVAMMLLSGKYFGWYWFPVIVLIPFLVNEATLATRGLKAVLTFLLIANAVLASSLIVREVRAKWEHVAILRNQTAIEEAMMKLIAQSPVPIDYTVNMTPVFTILQKIKGPKVIYRRLRAFPWLSSKPQRDIPENSRILCVAARSVRNFEPLRRFYGPSGQRPPGLQVWSVTPYGDVDLIIYSLGSG